MTDIKTQNSNLPHIVLAPLRGVTPLTYRNAFMDNFGGLSSAVSPFLTTVAGTKIKATHLADIMPEANEKLELVPQIIGKNPFEFRVLLEAIKDLGYNSCDLNSGCPWPMIVKKNRGSGMLRDPDNMRRMLDVGCDVMPNGISIKVRLGIDAPDLLIKFMEIFQDYPLSEITVHPRTAKQQYKGQVNLDVFEQCLALAKCPVVYNGDIRTPEDLKYLQNRFPTIDRWMIGRGLISDPLLLKKIEGADISNANALIQAFLEDYANRVQSELCGPSPFLGRMKEMWSYVHTCYKNGEKVWHKIRICTSIEEYTNTVNSWWKKNPKYIGITSNLPRQELGVRNQILERELARPWVTT